MTRQSLTWAGAALLGIVATAALAWSASQIASQRIGIASEPLSVANGLAPREIETSPVTVPHRRASPRSAPHRAAVSAPPAPATTQRAPMLSSGFTGSGSGSAASSSPAAPTPAPSAPAAAAASSQPSAPSAAKQTSSLPSSTGRSGEDHSGDSSGASGSSSGGGGHRDD